MIEATRRPTVLVLLAHYLPGESAGGPVWSIRSLVRRLGADLHFRIVTSDHDYGNPTPYDGVPADTWLPHEAGSVLYLSKRGRSLASICSLLRATKHDILYVNSVFARQFSILPVVLRRMGLVRSPALIIAPRGEFSPGALQLKGTRKRLYLGFARLTGIYDQANIAWQASTELEAAEIKHVLDRLTAVTVAPPLPDGTAVAPVAHRLAIARDLADLQPSAGGGVTKQRGRLRLVFVSRLCRKKNLCAALEMLQGVRGLVDFDIYGPIEDEGYWNECLTVASTLPPDIRVTYRGTVSHADVASTFGSYHAFLFPTLGENYGHVVCESLAAGCPVILSNRTPWRKLEELGVGWDLPLEQPRLFTAVIQHCVDLEGPAMAALSAQARAYGRTILRDPVAIDQNRAMFAEAYAAGASGGDECETAGRHGH